MLTILKTIYYKYQNTLQLRIKTIKYLVRRFTFALSTSHLQPSREASQLLLHSCLPACQHGPRCAPPSVTGLNQQWQTKPCCSHRCPFKLIAPIDTPLLISATCHISPPPNALAPRQCTGSKKNKNKTTRKHFHQTEASQLDFTDLGSR